MSQRRIETLDRKPPYDLDAEMATLGSLMLTSELVDEAALIVSPSDFFDDRHRIIFEQMIAMQSGRKRFDLILMMDSLKAANALDQVGGSVYLSKVLNCVPHAGHLRYYAEIVRDHAIRRGMILAANRISDDGYDAHDPVPDYISRSEASIFAAGTRCQASSGTSPDLRTVVLTALDGLDQRAKGQAFRGLSTGFHAIDNLTGGLQKGEVTILAGRTSMGKTAMAINIARNVAQSEPVLMFSLEMDALSICERLLAMAAKADLRRMRDGMLSNESRQNIVAASGDVTALKMRIEDTSGRTVPQIASVCRRQQRRDGLSLIVIDYLQMLYPENGKDQRHEQVAKISRGIKTLARELSVPILCLAQLNRQTTTAKDNRPALSHLRESGAIEQDADVVMFPHRPAYYSGGKCEGPSRSEEAEVIIAKNRNGPTGSVDVVWHGAWASFANKAANRFSDENKAKRITAFDEFNSTPQEDERF